MSAQQAKKRTPGPKKTPKVPGTPVLLRNVPTDLHSDIKMAAEVANVSLQQWIIDAAAAEVYRARKVPVYVVSLTWWHSRKLFHDCPAKHLITLHPQAGDTIVAVLGVDIRFRSDGGGHLAVDTMFERWEKDAESETRSAVQAAITAYYPPSTAPGESEPAPTLAQLLYTKLVQGTTWEYAPVVYEENEPEPQQRYEHINWEITRSGRYFITEQYKSHLAEDET